MRTSPRRSARIAAGAVGIIVAVLGLAQLLLPGLAAQRVRSELAHYGVVHSASISALPAIELLWGQAQSASVSAANISMSPARAGELLWKGRGVQRIDLQATSLRVASFTLHDVTFRKRGDRLYTSGRLSEADLRASLPGSTAFKLLANRPGEAVMRVSGDLFGATASVEVQLRAVGGELVAQPQGSPLAGLVKVRLLSEPHMYVQSFSLTPSPHSTGVVTDPSYQVSITARLR